MPSVFKQCSVEARAIQTRRGDSTRAGADFQASRVLQLPHRTLLPSHMFVFTKVTPLSPAN